MYKIIIILVAQSHLVVDTLSTTDYLEASRSRSQPIFLTEEACDTYLRGRHYLSQVVIPAPVSYRYAWSGPRCVPATDSEIVAPGTFIYTGKDEAP